MDHRDLDGTARLYGQTLVADLDWTVYAGADKADALAAANRLSDREMMITAIGLLVVLAAVVVIYRRIARPIRRLSVGVRAATAHTSSEPITLSGPAEVSTLVDDFNRLITSANRELVASSRLAAIVESSEAIVGATLGGVITSWNAGSERIYGHSASEIIGRKLSELFLPDRVWELAPKLERVRQGERAEPLETTHVRKDGRLLHVSMTISPIRDAGGTVSGASTVSHDMTEHIRAEVERRDLQERLRRTERLESLEELAGIAHDFNNLLAVIMNYAAFVAEQTSDQAVRADVEQIRGAPERAARLTRQLLIFARRETSQPDTINLNAVVGDIHNLLSRTIGEHTELVVQPAGDLPAIRVDHGQIEQVLVNLAVNARDAMPQGGTLTIETNSIELDEGYARLHPDISPGNYVELAVSDTGIGISEEIISTGLGLATVYGIVTEAGGSMSVCSEEGIGTTFRLYFPASDAPARVSTAAEAPPQGNGATILVVEDDPAVLELTSRILSANAYVVLEASSYESAIAQATAHDFQLLLTDSVMPQISGRSLAERIGEIRPGRPVLFMSGYSPGVIGPLRILDHGAALVQKPFNERTLLEKVHAALQR